MIQLGDPIQAVEVFQLLYESHNIDYRYHEQSFFLLKAAVPELTITFTRHCLTVTTIMLLVKELMSSQRN